MVAMGYTDKGVGLVATGCIGRCPHYVGFAVVLSTCQFVLALIAASPGVALGLSCM